MTDREPALKKRRKARNRVDNRLQQEEQPPLHNVMSDADELTQQLPFCCASCHCATQHPERLRSLEDFYPDGETVPYWISPADGHLDHLKCCHGVLPRYKEKELAYESPQEFKQRLVRWAPPVTTAIEEASLVMERGEMLRPEFYRELEFVYRKQIEEAYTTAKAQETKVSNDSNLAAECQRLLTNADYQHGVLRPFQLRLQNMETGRQEKKAAVVLDAFAGIGTGVLCLKRLGIDMRKVIHIEHDKVATWVYQVNHNAQEDGIEHVYEYSTWEDFVGSSPDETYTKLETLLDNHGPIDIVIGGPPCIDYSKVNAYAQGTQGEQGKYLLELGRIVRAIEKIQSPHPLYFLAENVFLSGVDRETVNDAFGLTWDPINLDSQDFSPARRNRHFWTNIPCNTIDYNTAAARVGPDSCLEDGFILPAHIVDPDSFAKCNCIMASRTRIDDVNTLRMYVFKNQPPKEGKYEGRPLTVKERERLMGYFEGYVEQPVRDLFQKLRDDGLMLQMMDDDDWRDRLDEKYHCFAGNYHNLDVTDYHRFDIISEPPFVSLKLAPPVKGITNVSFFNAMDYSKHLLGNAFSVPVVELLLQPLQGIFGSRQYPKYDYKFAWEPDM